MTRRLKHTTKHPVDADTAVLPDRYWRQHLAQVYPALDNVHCHTMVSVAKNNSGCPMTSCSRPRRKVVLIPHFQRAEKEGAWVGKRIILQ